MACILLIRRHWFWPNASAMPTVTSPSPISQLVSDQHSKALSSCSSVSSIDARWNVSWTVGSRSSNATSSVRKALPTVSSTVAWSIESRSTLESDPSLPPPPPSSSPEPQAVSVRASAVRPISTGLPLPRRLPRRRMRLPIVLLLVLSVHGLIRDGPTTGGATAHGGDRGPPELPRGGDERETDAQDDALEGLCDTGRVAAHPEDEVEDHEEQRAERGCTRPHPTTGEGGAAQHHGDDRREEVGRAEREVGGGQQAGQEDGSHADDERAGHPGRQPLAGGGQAAVLGGDTGHAAGRDPATGRVVAQPEGDDPRDDEGDDQDHADLGQPRPGEPGQVRRDVGDREHGTPVDPRDPGDQLAGGERDDQGVEPGDLDEEPVDQSDAQADDQGQRDGLQQSAVVARRRLQDDDADQGRRERDAQVDAAGADDERLAERHQDHHADGRREGREAGPAEQVDVEEQEADQHEDDVGEQDALTGQPERPAAHRPGGRGRGLRGDRHRTHLLHRAYVTRVTSRGTTGESRNESPPAAVSLWDML